jgi:hypothetical protein
MNERWNIKPEYKDALVRRLIAIVADPNSTSREATQASNALMKAESQNQADEHRNEQVDEERNRFLDIAERLGIATTVRQLPEARGSDDTESAS